MQLGINDSDPVDKRSSLNGAPSQNGVGNMSQNWGRRGNSVTIKQLINETGKPRLGQFDCPVESINYLDFDYRTPMYKAASYWKKKFHFKQFQFLGGVSEDLIFGCAFADTGYLGMVFLYTYNPKTNQLWKKTLRTPLAHGMKLSSSPENGVSTFEKGGWFIQQKYQRVETGHQKRLIVRGPDVDIEALIEEPNTYENMRLCSQTGHNGWTYAQKTAGVPVTGHCSSRIGEFNLEEVKSFGHHDFTAGYLRRETFWNWACFSTELDGELIGMNVSRGVNETTWSENCLWYNNLLQNTSGVDFIFDRDDLFSPWNLRSVDQSINLVFHPVNEHKERLDAWVFASNFHQLFGYFSGEIVVDGRSIIIEKAWGFVEDQYAKW